MSKFFTNTAGSYDKIVRYATFGKDLLWKRHILNKIHGNSILDLACGTGILTRMIAQKFQDATIVGVDITPSYLDVAKSNSKSFKNILFLHQDAEVLKIEQKFDSIVSSYIPKYCDAQTLIKKCILHLNPNGVIILHDFTYPKNIFIRYLWNSYFVLLHFIGYFIPTWHDAFVELPKLIRSSNWLGDYVSVMKKYGLDVDIEYMTLNSCAVIIGQKLNS
ncbi:class I SAM-dependent methyltransferase [Nitrosarchaeum sp.]|uniref:class I SAM-dependent methyltransferase n=1 Tax=Nitrosarchaeum sp. TaxID=2026886 RepID=UPI0026275011|nr:class I SAM-dependent methyltransferase [Nitrosarchaeum sp.]